GILNTKTPQLLLVRNRSDFVTRLIKLAQYREPKLRQRRHFNIWHRAVRLLPIVNLFEDDDRARIDLHSQPVIRSHDRERAGDRLWAVRRVKRNRTAQHHVLHVAKLLAALRRERSLRELDRRTLGSNHYGRRSITSITGRVLLSRSNNTKTRKTK